MSAPDEDDGIVPFDGGEMSAKPFNRETRLAAAMEEALTAHPEYGGDVQAIALIDTAEAGGIKVHGYTDTTNALVNLFGHLQAVFRANGLDLSLIPLLPPDDPRRN